MLCNVVALKVNCQKQEMINKILITHMSVVSVCSEIFSEEHIKID